MSQNVKKIKTRIQSKYDVEKNWDQATFTPLKGEVIYYGPDKDENGNVIHDYTRYKVGDGVTPINDLELVDSQGDWNQNDSTKCDFIKNKPSIKKGDGEGSLVINEGNATGDFSIAGGTTNKALIEDLVGSTIASITTLNKSNANGVLSIALGADNNANTGGSVAMGYDNISGGKGYYFDDIDFTNRIITLSSTRRTSTLVEPTYPSSVNWAAGDKLFIVNDDRYWLEVESVNGNKVTVKELPFSSIGYESKLSIFTYSKPNDRSVINVNKPENGVVDIGWGAFSIGTQNTVVGSNSYAVGYKNTIAGDFGTAFGQENIVGYSAFATGVGNQAKGKAAFASGDNTEAIGSCSHTEGHGTIANANYAHAEGYKSTASNENAHAEGIKTFASGYASHAEGNQTQATNEEAHAEGYITEASGAYSHAEGSNTVASNRDAHAEGHATLASGAYSHAGGIGTIASGDAQTAIGRYNAENPNALFIVGNGSAGGDEFRSNVFEIISGEDGAYATINEQKVATVNDISNLDSRKLDKTGNTITDEFEFNLRMSQDESDVDSVITLSNGMLSDPGIFVGAVYNPDMTATWLRANGTTAGLYYTTMGGASWNGTYDSKVEVQQNTINIGFPNSNLRIVKEGEAFVQRCDTEFVVESEVSDICLVAPYGNVTIQANALKIGNVELTEAKLKKLLDFIDTIEG